MNTNTAAPLATPNCDKLCCCHFRDCSAARTRIVVVAGSDVFGFCDQHLPAAVADLQATPIPFVVRP